MKTAHVGNCGTEGQPASGRPSRRPFPSIGTPRPAIPIPGGPGRSGRQNIGSKGSGPFVWET
jgi:hypothetical protein